MAHEPTGPSIPYVAVVAAAGTGERMGGPKALLAIRWGEGTGELPLAIAHARAHLDGGAERVVVVVRAEVARTLSRFAQRGLEIAVSSAAPELGPAGSIHHALKLLAQGRTSTAGGWLMIEPVDMPPSSAAIRRELLAGAARSPAPAAVRPVYQGKRGHPVLVQRRYLDPMLAASPPPLRDVLHGLGDYVADSAEPAGTRSPGVLDVDVIDKRAITTFEVPADVAAFYGHTERFFEEDEPTFA